jgi:hypothetical protein
MIRLLLVLACLLLLALTLLGMRRGWRNRLARQAWLAPLPDVPPFLGEPELPPLTGVYVGTTFASRWQDRIAHAGLGFPAAAVLSLHPEGVLFDRDGAERLFLPAGAVVEARLAPGLAGVVVGEGGLLVIGWQLGDTRLDTALRADDKRAYPDWVRRINAKVEA